MKLNFKKLVINLVFKYIKGDIVSDYLKVDRISRDSIIKIKEVIDADDYIDSDISDDLDEEKGENREIKFILHKEGIEFIENCKSNEKIIRVKKRIAKKFNKHINNLILLFNSYKINERLTINQIGLLNNSNVYILEKNNSIKVINEEENLESDDDESKKIKIDFVTVMGGKHNIIATKNTPIGIVLLFYLFNFFPSEQVMEYINGEKKIDFLFNASRLTINDNKKLGKIFHNILNPKILVNKEWTLI